MARQVDESKRAGPRPSQTVIARVSACFDERLRFEAALALSTLLTLLGYKLWVAFPLKLLPALVGWLLEVLLLWLCLRGVGLLARRSLSLARVAFLCALYALLLCGAAHAFFFESAAERRFSLLEVGLSGVLYFFANVLPVQGYLAFGLVFGVAHGLAFLLRRGPLPALFASGRVGHLLAPLCVLGVAIVGRPPSPVVDAAADIWEKVSTPSVRASAGKARYATSALDHSQSPPGLAQLSSPFKKIIVLVMETETAAAFALESQVLPANTFVHSGLPHAHRYERYFPNNQDSRTGMLDMLSSRFVPYDAYTEAGRDSYTFLSQKSSLPGELAELGFATAFAVSQNEIELVVGDLPWQQRIHLDDAKLSAAKARGLLCFTPYEFEHSCEDRALLPEVFAFLDNHERAFLYQEFIWGHASIYNTTSGKSNAAYYSSYVDALIEHLRARGTLDETLIVLTSDHGFRDTAMQDQLGVYRIPLWFYATRFSAEQRDGLYSHLNFKNLLHAERTLGALPPESPFIMIYGPTSSSLVAVLTRESEFLLLKLRGEQAYVLRHARLDASGAQTGPGKDARAPADFLRLFEDYKRRFDAH
jgi:hypothetical protein